MDKTFWEQFEKALKIGEKRWDSFDHGANIHESSTWPPGAIMAYWSSNFFGVGIVVANVGDRIKVLWDSKCRDPLLEYTVRMLNPRVIRKVR